MRDPREVQRELDAAQADLERDVTELKHFVTAKLEAPKHVLALLRSSIESVDSHLWLAAIVALAAGAALGAVRARGVGRG